MLAHIMKMLISGFQQSLLWCRPRVCLHYQGFRSVPDIWHFHLFYVLDFLALTLSVYYCVLSDYATATLIERPGQMDLQGYIVLLFTWTRLEFRWYSTEAWVEKHLRIIQSNIIMTTVIVLKLLIRTKDGMLTCRIGWQDVWRAGRHHPVTPLPTAWRSTTCSRRRRIHSQLALNWIPPGECSGSLRTWEGQCPRTVAERAAGTFGWFSVAGLPRSFAGDRCLFWIKGRLWIPYLPRVFYQVKELQALRMNLSKVMQCLYVAEKGNLKEKGGFSLTWNSVTTPALLYWGFL